MRVRTELLLVLTCCWSCSLAAGCGGGTGENAPVPPEGLADFDVTAVLLRGPWLTPAGPGAITVHWSTDEPSRSLVEYGLDATYGSLAQGTTAQPSPETDGELSSTGWQHAVTLSGLEGDRVYHYRIVSLAQPTTDATLLPPPPPGRSFVFALMGDVRSGDAEHQLVVDAVAAEAPELIVNTGDLVPVGGVETLWDVFFQIEGDLLTGTAVLPVFGNHEAALGRTLFGTYFPTPAGGLSSRTYSATWGDLHVAVIDRYVDDLDAVTTWLAADLASPEAQAARLRVVSLHVPFYTFSNHEPDLDGRAALWPVLKAAGVGLVVTGHNHLYERFFVDGVHQVVTGGGGAALYGTDDRVVPEEEPLRRAAASQYHFLVGELGGDGVRFEVRPVPEGALLDCFVIDPEQPGAELSCP